MEEIILIKKTQGETSKLANTGFFQRSRVKNLFKPSFDQRSTYVKTNYLVYS